MQSKKHDHIESHTSFLGTSDQVSSTGSNMFCLEVGTAHRYTAGHTIQLNDNALIVYPVRFVQVAPVGGAHL